MTVNVFISNMNVYFQVVILQGEHLAKELKTCTQSVILVKCINDVFEAFSKNNSSNELQD